MAVDNEHKITQFDYEKYLHPESIKDLDTSSPDFLNDIKILNITTKTRYERLQKAKEDFRELMPYLRGLNQREQRTLIHLVKSRASKFN